MRVLTGPGLTNTSATRKMRQIKVSNPDVRPLRNLSYSRLDYHHLSTGFSLVADTWNILALREHLLAQVHNTHPVPLKVEGLQPTSSVSPQDQNIDPAIAGAGIMGTSTAESGGDENGSDGKKSGKRALSTSKRAAQNRQAQVCVMFLFCFVFVLVFYFFIYFEFLKWVWWGRGDVVVVGKNTELCEFLKMVLDGVDNAY